MSNIDKKLVQDFWEQASCGERLYLSDDGKDAYSKQLRRRYELEPYIAEFAGFEAVNGKDVLEIGVGLGADHQRLAQGGARLTGIDLTERAIAHVKRRLELLGLSSTLITGDAENLPFADD